MKRIALVAAFIFAGLVAAAEVTYPPKLPGDKDLVTDRSGDFLKPPTTLQEGVKVAKVAPTIDFAYFPGQTYKPSIWSVWGDSTFANGKYYAAFGDHIGPAGNAFVYEYDPATKSFKQVLDLKKLLNLPEGHYSPAKIHSRVDLGDDGWIYCSTHRGSTTTTTDKYHYKGDWVVRANPQSGQTEIVVAAPVAKHCLPCGLLDPKRLIWYGGTAPGSADQGKDIHFFAYDCKNKKMLYDGVNGPARCIALAKSTGRVYFTGSADDALMRYDPAAGGAPVKIDAVIGMRAATDETPQGIIYTLSQGNKDKPTTMYALDTKTEKVTELGPATVGQQQYVASMDADPTGRYVYYIPGAHGHSSTDGSAVVQYDTRTKTRKVIAFLTPFYKEKYGCTPEGTYSTVLDAKGETLFVTWNTNRASKAWDSVAMSAIHIPAEERQP